MTALTMDRVTLRGPRAVKPRKRAVRRLERIDPAPPGAPSEILIVRKLDDPAPGMLARTGRSRVLAKWETAFASALSAIRSRARRLRPGEDGMTAEAVVFADEAEMIACLAERIAAGAAPGWWARALLRRLPPRPGVGALLAHQPHLVLPAIAVLIERETAASVLSKMARGDLETIEQIIGLPPPAPCRPEADRKILDADIEDAEPRPIPPALQKALETGTPVTARLAAAAWIRQVLSNMPQQHLAQMAERIARRYSAGQSRNAIGQNVQSPKPAARNNHKRQPGHHADAPQNLQSAPSAPGTNTKRIEKPGEYPADNGAAPDQKARPETGLAPHAGSPGTPSEPAATEPSEQMEAPNWTGSPTALGGIPFLVNLYVSPIRNHAERLCSALDETARAEDGKWTALERLARAILADEPAPGGDTIWTILAALDGRPDDAPALPNEADHHAAQACNGWLETVLGKGEDAPAFARLLYAPARLHVTPVHLDVVFPAHSQNINARRAGLDLDPGWQPRFGRIIAFHYMDEESF